MKKIIFIVIALFIIIKGFAQDAPQPGNGAEGGSAEQAPTKIKNEDERLPHITIDANFRYGTVGQQSLEMVNPQTAYNNSVNTLQPQVKISGGNLVGGDMQFGYFFGKEHIFGIGTGAMFTIQKGNLNSDTFHVEYEAFDQQHGNTPFRQIITAGNLSENFTSTNISIPLLLKFKHQFPGSEFGVSADAGPFLNINVNNTYSNNAAFNYEAAYDITGTNTAIYDNGATLSGSDWKIIQSSTNGIAYFDSLKNKGYNVGLNQKPAQYSPVKTFNALGYGFMLQASISYQLSYHVALNLGGYFMYQEAMNKPNDSFHVTDKAGTYNSLLGGVKSMGTSSFGGVIGARFFLSNGKVAAPKANRDVIEQAPIKIKNKDEHLPHITIDVNFRSGTLGQQSLVMVNPQNAYYNSVNTLPPEARISGMNLVGGDMQFGYFFGREHVFGIGTGAMYTIQKGNLNMDTFHVEYEAFDQLHGNTPYRQIITAGNLSENFTSTNISIPLLLKFKHQFQRSKFGISADAGPFLNINVNNTYSNNTASFNYEAAYDVTGTNAAIYDNGNTLSDADWKIIQSSTNGTAYFDSLKSKGYNVGLNQKPAQYSAVKTFNALGYGFMLQAGISYQLGYHVALNLGGYFMYQEAMNTGNSNYHITDTIGQYHSLLGGVKSMGTTSFGGVIGVRFLLGHRDNDIDGDGIPDKEDQCPYRPGPKIFNGCPDSDNDGIPDQEDGCPTEPGPAYNNGCPVTTH